MQSTRREFAATVLSAPLGQNAGKPWFERAFRWGQTNITEKDPVRYDIAWWREQWRRTSIQGVILNAGGIVAYYPSRFPLHHRAAFLNGRDLFGELVRAAREEGLCVLARMDSNRASEDLYKAEPSWFARKKDGEPYRAEDKYVTCIHGPYYSSYLPEILREIIQRDHPDGFGDNSWAGLGRDSICYCESCSKSFRDRSGQRLPEAVNWDDPAYRAWIRWGYARRLELWDLNNRVTQQAGGPHCLWIGMISGSISGQARSLRDSRLIARRSPFLLVDHQSRGDGSAFHDNTDAAKLLHNAGGWNHLMPESMAMYHSAGGYFRLAANPPVEARLWLQAGVAGGFAPWWHHIGAYQEDRRAYLSAPPAFTWHKQHEAYLRDRTPVAPTAIVWSQANHDFYGKAAADSLVEAPWRGFRQALRRARLLYQPVHADDLETALPRLKTLVLPNVGALSDAHARLILEWVRAGGSLVATGVSSLYDEDGQRRPDFALADVFGVHLKADPPASPRTQHSYLRLAPERRGHVDGPQVGGEPKSTASRHPLLAGFDSTDILPFGGLLPEMDVEPGRDVLATFVPPFPQYPPETSYMRVERTNVPALVAGRFGRGRVAYLPADLDRRYAQDLAPDHGRLLANLVRWAEGEPELTVEGPGLLSVDLYEQPGRLVLHLVNETSAAFGKNLTDELIPVGPLRVTLKRNYTRARLLVAGRTVNAGGPLVLERVADHEVVVFE